jgi:hypothetical protein
VITKTILNERKNALPFYLHTTTTLLHTSPFYILLLPFYIPLLPFYKTVVNSEVVELGPVVSLYNHLISFKKKKTVSRTIMAGANPTTSEFTTTTPAL